MWTGMLLGIVCWLVYRQGKLAAAGGSLLTPTNRGDAQAELLDRDGRAIKGESPPKSLPSWAWPLIAVAYGVCPLDGDFIPVLGWIDDALVACFAVYKWCSTRRAQVKA